MKMGRGGRLGVRDRARRDRARRHWARGVGRLGVALVLAFTLGAQTRPLEAQISVGAQVSSAEYSGLGIGPRAVIDLGPFDAGLRVVGSFDIFFPGQRLLRQIAFEDPEFNVDVVGDPDYWEANLNLVYTLGLPFAPITPYLGGGLNIAHTKVTGTTDGLFDLDRTDQGVNVLAGVELDIAGVSPFFEFRYEVQGGEQWVVTGGIVF